MENLLNNNNICSEWVVVTPQLANDLLQTQITNRPISYVKVAEYAELMKEGKWEQCGDTICVDENNHLTDGQHRLLAIVKSGISQKMLLVRGIKHSIYKDTGSKRSLTGNIKIASDAPEEVKIGSAIELARFITSLVNNSRKANITEVDAF